MDKEMWAYDADRICYQRNLLFAMGQIMSSITQRARMSTWVEETGRVIREYVRESLRFQKTAGEGGEPCVWFVTHDEALILSAMSRMLGGWAEFNMDGTGDVFILLQIPPISADGNNLWPDNTD
jgi:hypothetical protein